MIHFGRLRTDRFQARDRKKRTFAVGLVWQSRVRTGTEDSLSLSILAKAQARLRATPAPCRYMAKHAAHCEARMDALDTR